MLQLDPGPHSSARQSGANKNWVELSNPLQSTSAPMAAKVVWKGTCPICNQAVLSDQERVKEKDADRYFHMSCHPGQAPAYQQPKGAVQQPGIAPVAYQQAENFHDIPAVPYYHNALQPVHAPSSELSGLSDSILSAALETIGDEGESAGKTRTEIILALQDKRVTIKDFHGIVTLYTGDVDDQNNPHGQGVQIWLPECSYYSGSFEHGMRKGMGKHTYKDINRLGCIYHGEFELFGTESKFHSKDGRCTATFSDGSMFWGVVLENCPVEGGLQKDNKVYHVRYDRRTYIFHKDLRPITQEYYSPWQGIGHGKSYFKGEMCDYVGSWTNGRPDGEGTMTWPEGSTYSGTWVNGNRQGWGTQKYMKVDRCKWERGTYTGEWEVFDNSSYYHGRGTAHFVSGLTLKDAVFRRCCPVSGTLVEPNGRSNRVTFSEMIYLWHPDLMHAMSIVHDGAVHDGKKEGLVEDFSGLSMTGYVGAGVEVMGGAVDLGAAAASEEAQAVWKMSHDLIKDVSFGSGGVGTAIKYAFDLTERVVAPLPVVGGILHVFAGIKTLVETHLRTQEFGKRLLIWLTSVVAMLHDLDRKAEQLQGRMEDKVHEKMERCKYLANKYLKVLRKEFTKKTTVLGKMYKQVKGFMTSKNLEENLGKIQTQMDQALSDLMLQLIDSMFQLQIVTMEEARKMQGSINMLMDRMRIVADMQQKLMAAYDKVVERLDDHEERLKQLEKLQKHSRIIAPTVDEIISDRESREFWRRWFGDEKKVAKGAVVEKLKIQFRMIDPHDLVRAADLLDADGSGTVTAWEFNDFTILGGLSVGLEKVAKCVQHNVHYL